MLRTISLAQVLAVGVCLLCFANGVPQQRFRKAKRAAEHVASQGQLSPRATGQDPCQYLVNQYKTNSVTQFNASQVYECLITVPFNRDGANALLRYWRQTCEFQSTLAYLKAPPHAYQQPPIDMLNALDMIQDQIDSGIFTNEYSFEAALQRTVYAAHDTHFYLSAGLIELFSFGPPITIKSVSTDGVDLPKPYVFDDLYNAPSEGWTPSAIKTINGEPAVQYLQRYAKLNSQGNLEPHTDYNALMQSPALDILGYYATFDVINDFYHDRYLTVAFENGTTLPRMDYQAVAYFFNYDDIPTINNGQDLYDFFVRIPPENATADATSATTTSQAMTATPTPTPSPNAYTWVNNTELIHDDSDPLNGTQLYSWYDVSGQTVTAYPMHPDVVQPNLVGDGVVSGYLLNSSAVGVLSLPSFVGGEENLDTFSDTIGLFLNRSQAAGMKKIVIDLQGNLGGDALLAYDAARRFFPNADAYGGSRQRAFGYADVLGTTFSQYFHDFLNSPESNNETIKTALVDIPWAVQNYENIETGHLFSSWQEYFGPRPDRGDFFTVPQRYNLSDPFFDITATTDGTSSDNNEGDDDSDDSDDSGPQGIVVYGYANRTAYPPTPQYSPDDIVILTDGLCASACSIFHEAMTQMGVKTVVVGGQPIIGPMQSVGGTRGARMYSSFDIDTDIASAAILNNSVTPLLPQDRLDLNFTINTASINLQDQIRPNYYPLQFAFSPADCRIFYTMANHNNYTRLWLDAAQALWRNSGKCVPDSTGWNKGTTDMYGPTDEQKLAWRAGKTTQGNSTAAATPPPATTPQVPGQSMHSEETDLDMALGLLGNRTGIVDTSPFGGRVSSSRLVKNTCLSQGLGCAAGGVCAYVSTCNSAGTFETQASPQCVFPCGSTQCGGTCPSKGLSCTGVSCVMDASCLPGAPKCGASLSEAGMAAKSFAKRKSQAGNTAGAVVKVIAA